MQSRKITYFLLATLILMTGAEARVKISKKTSSKTVQQRQKYKNPAKTSSQEYMTGVGDIENKTSHDLINMIKGFHFLVKDEKRDGQRAQYSLSISASYLALARYYRVKTKMGPVEKKNEKVANERVIKILDPVVASKAIDSKTKAKAVYYQGLSHINMGYFDRAQRSFEQSLAFHKDSGFAPSISLYLAESRFEKEKYKEAISFYRAYFDRLTDQQKALSIYKTAWCYINLSDLEKSERYFLSLIGKKAAGSFADDSLKDLSYVVTMRRNEKEIIDFSVREFSKKELIRVQFLTEVYFYFQSQSGNRKKPLILTELLRIEKDPPKRFRILASTMRSSQKLYASTAPYEEYQRIRREIESYGFKPGLSELGETAIEVESEMLTMIKADFETLAGKVKTPEGLKKEEVFRRLEEVLDFHLVYFKSAEREKSYQVWISTCEKMQDPLCLYKVSHRIRSEKTISEQLHKDAGLMLLKALEQLTTKDKKYRDEFIAELESFLNIRKETEPEWKPAAIKLTMLYNEKKEFTKSLPIMIKIHEITNSSESFYRLQFARFEMGLFLELVKAEGEYKEDKFTEDARNLKREAHLKLATQAQETNQFEEYKTHLQAFLALKPEEAKADLARKSFISQLVEKAKWKDAYQEFSALPVEKRFRDDFRADLTRSLMEFVKDAEFPMVLGLTEKIPKGNVKGELGFFWLSAELGDKKGEIDFNGRWKDLSYKQKEYGLGVLALTKPQKVIDSFQSQKSFKMGEKKLLLLSYQMRDQSQTPQLNSWAKMVLAGMVAGPGKAEGESKSEKGYREIRFPKEADSPTRYAKWTGVALESIRFLRKRVLKDIDSGKMDSRIRILNNAMANEKKMAESLRKAPVPEGLNEKQLAEYKKGIEDAALEFDNQAGEFDKVRMAVQAKVTEEEKNRWPIPSQDQWPWPDKAWTSIVRELVDKENPTGALVTLDQRRSEGSVSVDDYYQARTKILFSLGNHMVLSDYIKNELKQANQETLLAAWQKTFEKEAP